MRAALEMEIAKTGQADDADERHERLLSWTRERFPIGHVEFAWGGQYMETIDGLAFIGRNPMDEENVFVVTGDCGAEVYVNGRQRDPRSALKQTGGDPIPAAERSAFAALRDRFDLLQLQLPSPAFAVHLEHARALQSGALSSAR